MPRSIWFVVCYVVVAAYALPLWVFFDPTSIKTVAWIMVGLTVPMAGYMIHLVVQRRAARIF